jgi:hypothetical protein
MEYSFDFDESLLLDREDDDWLLIRDSLVCPKLVKLESLDRL